MKKILVACTLFVSLYGSAQVLISSTTKSWNAGNWENRTLRVFEYADDEQVGCMQSDWADGEWIESKKLIKELEGDERVDSFYDLSDDGQWYLSLRNVFQKSHGITLSEAFSVNGEISSRSRKIERIGSDDINVTDITYQLDGDGEWMPMNKSTFEKLETGGKKKMYYTFKDGNWNLNHRVIFPPCGDYKVTVFQSLVDEIWTDYKRITKITDGLTSISVTETYDFDKEEWIKISKCIYLRHPIHDKVVERTNLIWIDNEWCNKTFTVFNYSNPIMLSDDVSSSTASRVNIFPNPANDFIQLEFDSFIADDKQLLIYNAMGERVENLILRKDEKKITVDIRSLENGTYYFVNEGGALSKFVKL